MTPDEQELANCRREAEWQRNLASTYQQKSYDSMERWILEMQRKAEILARIEAAKGSTDGN